MRRFLILITLCMVLASSAYALEIAPSFVGNSATDSIYVTFTSCDTTYYPEIHNMDSLVLLRYGPSGTLVDSLGEDAATVKNFTTGFYRIAYRGSDGSATLGTYTVVVKGWYAGAIRGISSGTYSVLDEAMAAYLAHLDVDVSSRGTSNLIASDNIGVNLGDVTNQSATLSLPNATIGTATNLTNKVIVSGIDGDAVNSIALSADAVAEIQAGLSAFDPATDQVIVVTNNDKTGYLISGTKQTLDALNDPSASTIYAFFTSGSNEDVFKAVTTGLALETSITAVRDSVSLGYVWNEAEKDTVLEATFGTALYWGAMNNYGVIFFPGDTTYVDSMQHYQSGASPDSIRATTYVSYNAQYQAGARFKIW